MIDEAALKLSRRLSGSMDLDDMLSTLNMMERMGPMKVIIQMVPGLRAQIPRPAFTGHIRRMKAIILSMTPDERSHSAIIGRSRQWRIARGSGTSIEEVGQLLAATAASKR